MRRSAFLFVVIFGTMPEYAAPSEAPAESRATVNADAVPVHPETSTASQVMRTLAKGEAVTIGYSVETADGEWCSLSGAPRGYVLCRYLIREAPQPETLGAPLPTVLTQTNHTARKGDAATATARQTETFTPSVRRPEAFVPPATVVPSVFTPEQSALIAAAKLGNVSAIQMALQKGAIAGGRDKDGKTALLWAASMGRAAVVEEMLSGGADVNTPDNLGWTPLEAAVWARHPDVARLLLDGGAEVNARDSEGRSPLMHAAQYGDLVMIGDLLSKGADPNARNRFDQTPLMFAVALNDAAAAEALLAAGADVNARDAAGRSVLINAVLAAAERPANIQLLLHHASDLNAKDNDGHTALTWAVKKGHPAIAQMLKKAGATEW